MALYAAGFNAWNQLRFEKEPEADPEDIFTFANVLTDEAVERPRAGLHYTLVRGKSGYHVAGNAFATGRGTDHDHMDTTFVAGNGWTLAVLKHRYSAEAQKGDSEAPSRDCIVKYESYGDFEADHAPVALPCKTPVQQVAAYEVGFVLLFQDGTIETLGDARYQECLARDITSESAADRLGLVPDLMSLGDPVRHVSANGYVLAALTESGSVYVWGRNSRPGHCQEAGVFGGLSAIPSYCEVGEGLDVQDIALGESHAVALTTDGRVYVIGTNRNGQLGIGQSRDCIIREWTCVDFDPPRSHHVVGVAAGPRSSFIITARR